MKIVSFSEAISYIQNDDLILIGGSGGGHAVPEGLIKALQSRFLKENTPQNLTLLHPAGIGDHSTGDLRNNLDEALTLLVDANDRLDILKKYNNFG